jgi:hypothetical protein
LCGQNTKVSDGLKKQPFAVTSGKYQDFEKEHLEKTTEEEQKQGWKRKLQAKQEKKKDSKHIAVKKLSKEAHHNVECNSVCCICKRRIKHGCQLHCDNRQNLYNELCNQNTINTFQFWKMVIHFCHSCYNEENTNSADEMTLVEENNDSDINEMHMPATQK